MTNLDNTDNPVKIITLTGDLGAGKSLVAKKLQNVFDADYYSTGEAQRKIAGEMGITTLDLNRLAETEKWVDEKIDSIFKDLKNYPNNLIVDSRMAWHFLPNSFKIRLEVNPGIGAERIAGDTSRIGETYNSTEETIQAIIDRQKSEQLRFMKYYDVDVCNPDNFDILIDTSFAGPETVKSKVLEAAESYYAGSFKPQVWISTLNVSLSHDVEEDGEIEVRKELGGPYILLKGKKSFHEQQNQELIQAKLST